jgi:hypothetical protein
VALTDRETAASHANWLLIEQRLVELAVHLQGQQTCSEKDSTYYVCLRARGATPEAMIASEVPRHKICCDNSLTFTPKPVLR